MRERIKWIDTSRFLGIFAIYLGHLPDSAGYAYPYVFQYHVPLFFFISGCMSTYDNGTKIGKFLLKKFKKILIPMWIFAVLSVVITVIQSNSTAFVAESLLLIAKGCVRNSFLAGSLWFFSCLFTTEVMFKLLSYLRNKWVVLIVASALHVVYVVVLDPYAMRPPSWWYNADSMLYYIFFYALGNVAYPSIQNLFQMDTNWKKFVFAILGILTTIIAVNTFIEKNTLLLVIKGAYLINIFAQPLVALILIYFNLFAAKLLEHVHWMGRIGRETLYLCGNEYIITILFPVLLSILGLELTLSTVLATYCYVLVIFFAEMKFLIPLEKQIAASIMGKAKASQEKL